jgi:hypothetical protein
MVLLFPFDKIKVFIAMVFINLTVYYNSLPSNSVVCWNVEVRGGFANPEPLSSVTACKQTT